MALRESEFESNSNSNMTCNQMYITNYKCILYNTWLYYVYDKKNQQQQQQEKTTVENHLKIKRKTTFTRFLLNDKTVNISVVSNQYLKKKNWDKITNTSYRLWGQRLNANSNLTLRLWFYRLITIYVYKIFHIDIYMYIFIIIWNSSSLLIIYES